MLSILRRVTFAILLFTAFDLSAWVRECFYVGYGTGDSIDSCNVKASFSLIVERSKRLDHIVQNAFVGWGYTTCCNFYVAAELGTYFPERSITIERPGANLLGFSFVDQVNVQDYLTGDILLGFRPDACFLYYLRGGVCYAHEQFHQFENSATTPIATPSNFEKNGAAWRLGAGINYALFDHFGIGVDYIFTSYRNLHFVTLLGTDLKAKIHANYIGISGIYSF
jgi:opacity protein-like surface antigen